MRIVIWKGLPAATLGALLSLSSFEAGGQTASVKPETKADFWVAPNGSDSAPGTAEAPFATLTRARDAVRKQIAVGLTKDTLVLVRGGTYLQPATLAFGPEDSGTEKFSVTYAAAPGAKVSLSGGRKIIGWQPGRGKIWTAEMPEVKAGGWYFRQLFVNDRRATRARTPNVDDPTPWWKIRTSTVKSDKRPPEDQPITVSVTGPIQAYRNPADVELVYIDNNAGSRKRLGAINALEQVFTLPPPHRWNPECFGTEWKLSIPEAGKGCYLENALEMLDQPGESYLDRTTGSLAYWPRADEDMSTAEVIAPEVQRTLLSIIGTRAHPVLNLHFRGIRIEHTEWPLPPWGYPGMFCCNVAVPADPNPGHKFTEAAVEFEYARSCSFVEGAIRHGGAMGLCLRRGTENIAVEGNEISDLGGGGVGVGYPNVAYGYLLAAPPPEPNEYRGYRIANNYVHHCGLTDYGAVGICLFSSQDSTVSHNLIHDIAYFGIGFAGSQDPKVAFARNNTIEYNHIHHAMRTTVDGAALYATFTQHGRNSAVRGNFIHDIVPNPFNSRQPGPYSAAGIYLDGQNSGCQYDHNVAFRTSAPLFINGLGKDLAWIDNLFYQTGLPPEEFIQVMSAYSGLEPGFQQSLLRTSPARCVRHVLSPARDGSVWTAYQFDLPKDHRGVVQIVCQGGDQDERVSLKLRDLTPDADYALKAYASVAAGASAAGPAALPALGKTVAADLSALGITARTPGRALIDPGLAVNLSKSPQILWIVYQKEE